MLRSVIPALLAAIVSCTGGLALADDPALRRYELPNLDTLELTLPSGWVDAVDAPPGGVPLTILLTPAGGAPFEVHVTPQWSEAADSAVMDADALRQAVREAALGAQAQAVEETLEIRRLQGASGVGFYYAATDRAPLPEEFRFMTQGALQAGDLVLWFTILTNDGQDSVVADALALLQSAGHRGTGIDRR